MTSTAFINSDGLNLIEIIQRLKLNFLEEDVTTYPIRQKHRELVIGMFWDGNREDVVKFFQGSLFRF